MRTEFSEATEVMLSKHTKLSASENQEALSIKFSRLLNKVMASLVLIFVAHLLGGNIMKKPPLIGTIYTFALFKTSDSFSKMKEKGNGCHVDKQHKHKRFLNQYLLYYLWKLQSFVVHKMFILLPLILLVYLKLPIFLNVYFVFKDVLSVWQSADAVCFDVDSTVCLDEGIDELADFCGAGQAVAEWTSRSYLVFFF
jgi:hypothetical protein